eukprot:tig00020816_g14207.t1
MSNSHMTSFDSQGRPALLEAFQTAGDKLISFAWETNSGVDVASLCGGKLVCQLRTFYIKITMFGRNGTSASSQTSFGVDNDVFWLSILAQVDRMLAMSVQTIQPSSNATYDVRFFKAPVVYESSVPVIFMPSFNDFTGIPQPLWWWVIADRDGFVRYDARSTAASFERFGVRSAYLYAYYASGDFNETYAAPAFQFEIASLQPPPPQALLRAPAFWGEFATIDAFIPPSNASAAPQQYQWIFNSANFVRPGGSTFVGTTAVASSIQIQSRPPPNIEVVFNWPTVKRKRNPACPEGTLCTVQWVPFLQYTYTVRVTGDLAGVAPVSWNISFGDGSALHIPAGERYRADFDEEEYCGPQFETYSGTKDFETYGSRTVTVSASNEGGVRTLTRPLNAAFPVQYFWLLAIGSLTASSDDSTSTFFTVDTSPRYDGVLPPPRWFGWFHNIAGTGVCNRGNYGFSCWQKLEPSSQREWQISSNIGALEIGGEVSLGSELVTRHLRAEADSGFLSLVLDTGFWKSRASPVGTTGFLPTWSVFGSAGNTPAFMAGHCNYFQACPSGYLDLLERLRLTQAGVPGPQYGGIVFFPWSGTTDVFDQFRFDAEVSMGSDTPGGDGVILSFGRRTTSDGIDRRLFVRGVGYLPTAGVSVVVLSVQRRVQLYWQGRTLLSTFDIPDTQEMRTRARLRGDPDPWPTRIRLLVRSDYRAGGNPADRCADVYVENIHAIQCVVLSGWIPKRDWAFAVSGFSGYADGNSVDEISLHYLFIRSTLKSDPTAETIALVPMPAHTSNLIEDFQYNDYQNAITRFPPTRMSNSVLLGAASPPRFPVWGTDMGINLIWYEGNTFGAWSFYLGVVFGMYINVLDPPFPDYVEFETLFVTWLSSATGDVKVDLLNPDGSVRATIADTVAVSVAFREQSAQWTIPGAPLKLLFSFGAPLKAET